MQNYNYQTNKAYKKHKNGYICNQIHHLEDNQTQI